MRRGLSSLVLLFAALPVLAQRPCTPANDRLNPLTLDFSSDCPPSQFCSPTSSTCTTRTCRKDEYPFGWGNATALAAICEDGFFCPDRGDGCRELVAVGGECELDRDDQCLPPPDEKTVSGVKDGSGALCLNHRCTYASVPQGQGCTVANTVFTGFADDGTAWSDVVTRDNCLIGLYCDPTALTCTPQLPPAAICTSDRSCTSSICAGDGRCAALKKPHSSSTAGAVVGVLFTLAVTSGFVFWLSKRGRRRRELGRIERKRVWEEQTQLRALLEEKERAERKERGWSWTVGRLCARSGEERGLEAVSPWERAERVRRKP